VIQEGAHHPFGCGVCQGGTSGQALRPAFGFGVKQVTGNHAVDDIPTVECCSIVKFTGKTDLSSTCRTAAFREKVGAAQKGRRTDVLFDLCKLRIFRGDDDIAAEGDFKSGRDFPLSRSAPAACVLS
jgi:hypothetical protein